MPGEQAFDLYATYGLPLEITRDIAREQGWMWMKPASVRPWKNTAWLPALAKPLVRWAARMSIFTGNLMTGLEEQGKLQLQRRGL